VTPFFEIFESSVLTAEYLRFIGLLLGAISTFADFSFPQKPTSPQRPSKAPLNVQRELPPPPQASTGTNYDDAHGT